MSFDRSGFQSALDRTVECAKSAGVVLRTGEAARQIRSDLPGCHLPSREIANLLARRAISAGVPIQFTSAD